MASDPRLNLFNFAGTILNKNPALFGVAHATRCPTVLNRLNQGSIDAESALTNTLGAVGNFANLASGLSGGPVGAGLSQLAAVSNAVRISGIGALPPAAINNGQSYVLNTVGIDQNQLNTASQFNPSVANATFGAASQVYNQVQQGKFTTNSIPSAFSALQNGTALISSLFTPDSSTVQPSGSHFGQLCGAQNYAQDLIALAPKYKFLFVVQFEFDPQFQMDVMGAINPAFVIKSSTRPSVDFEYEDINMYNFRTKVAKRTMYQPITMKFLDDDHNNAFQLYTTYLKLVSPIANINTALNNLDPLDAYDIAGGGMGFDSPTTNINAGWQKTFGQPYAASLGAPGNLNDNQSYNIRNILRRITIFHVYRQGRMMNVTHFYNPKFIKMELDEVDMSSSEGAEVGITFTYDSMFIIPGYRVFNDGNAPFYDLHDITNSGTPLGIAAATSVNDGNPKDGYKNGMAYGQDTLVSSTFNPTPSNANTITSSGSNLTGIASTAPDVGGGGTGTILNPSVAGDVNSLSEIVVTPNTSAVNTVGTLAVDPSISTGQVPGAVLDPIQGSTPASTTITAANQSAQTQISTVSVAYQTQLASAYQQYTAAIGVPGITAEQQNAALAAYQAQQTKLNSQYGIQQAQIVPGIGSNNTNVTTPSSG